MSTEPRWLACATQDEIAEAVGVSHGTVVQWEEEFVKTCATQELTNSRDFEVPLYNVWKQQTKSPGVSHPGNTEPRWLDNLLYLYTQPGDIVLDPFAGSGSTIDVCRKRGRRTTTGAGRGSRWMNTNRRITMSSAAQPLNDG